MIDIGVVASTTYSKFDTGVFIQSLDDSSDVPCRARLDNSSWINTMQSCGPVLLCLVLVLESKQARSQGLSRKSIFDVGAGLSSSLVKSSK